MPTTRSSETLKMHPNKESESQEVKAALSVPYNMLRNSRSSLRFVTIEGASERTLTAVLRISW